MGVGTELAQRLHTFDGGGVKVWVESILGRLLRGKHAGERYLAWNDLAVSSAPTSIRLISDAFADGESIPRCYAGIGVGDNVSPPLAWQGLPANTASVVLIIEDPDAPLRRPFVHALAWNLQPQTPLVSGALRESVATHLKPSGVDVLALGCNGFGKTAYAGPRALPNHGPHRYAFQLFALSHPLTLVAGATRKALLSAMQGAVLARGRLDGVFERPAA